MNEDTANNWHTIWSGKSANSEQFADLLQILIKANGFDSGAGNYTAKQWETMVSGLVNRAKIQKEHHVFEIGCGSGALLFQLSKITACQISGIDYSQSLIDLAAKNLKGTFKACAADKIPFPDNFFDVVISHSVFQYFPNFEYAAHVIWHMHRVLKRTGTVCLMDLNDKKTKTTYHAERRKGSSKPEEYDEKYRNLPHLFFDKNELVDVMKKIGFVDIQFFLHDVPEYLNSRFRFNVMAKKG